MNTDHEEEFLCSICYASTNVMKVTTTCGHQLCFNCTSQLVKHECPYCRTPFPSNTEMPNACCKSCSGSMYGVVKCCENAKCTMCLMADINEDKIGIESINTYVCEHCYKEHSKNVQQILNNKVKTLLSLKQKCLSMVKTDTYSHPKTLSYMNYDAAYNGILQLQSRYDNSNR